MNRPPRYANVIAVVLGFVAAFTPANLPKESLAFTTIVLISAVIFGTAGLLMGLLWPTRAWKWGLWVVAPGLFIVVISVIFSGEFGNFLRDDLPFLAAGLVTACLGGMIGARLSPRKSAVPGRESNRTSE